MEKELTLSELAIQHAELLPDRETLFFNYNWANVYATNTALAVNAYTFYSNAYADAYQKVVVTQH
jgi:hypothetical protein